MLHLLYTIPSFQKGKVKHSYHLLPLTTQEQKLHPLKQAIRKRCGMDDPYSMESQTYSHDDYTLENSHARELPTTKVEEYSLNEEEHNKRQHKPENEDRHLLKLKLNKMADQRFLNFMYRKLST